MMPWKALLLCGAAALAGCSGGERVGSTGVKPTTAGAGGMEIETILSPRNDSSGVDLYLAIPPAILTFQKQGTRFLAIFEVRVRSRPYPGEIQPTEQSWLDTMMVDDYRVTRQDDPVILRQWVPIPAGRMVVDVVVEDRFSGRQHIRATIVDVFDPKNPRPVLGSLVVRGAPRGFPCIPLLSFQIPSRIDSLEIRTRVFHLVQGLVGVAGLAVIRLNVDSTYSQPPYAFARYTSAFTGGEMRVAVAETIAVEVRSITGQSMLDSLTFALPHLPEGVYEVSLSVGVVHPPANTPDTVLFGRKLFAVRGITFPRPSTLNELTEELGYIARESELQTIVTAQTPAEKRERFDAFWLSLIHDKPLAAETIRKYYTRVEEANRLFTVLKDGWKTDRGMIYMILGPPTAISRLMGTETWQYGYSGSEAVNTYSFKALRYDGEGFSFEDYALVRWAGYDLFWEGMIERWRRGTVY